MTLESAVVGGGVVSDKHLAGLQRYPETDLVAVCDHDESRAKQKAMEYDVGAYADAEALLAREELDWLHICTPVKSRLELAEMALEDGLAVQIETPVTTSVGEAMTLERLAEDSDGRVSVAHGHSFDPVLRSATGLLADGRIGDLRSVALVYTGADYPDDACPDAWSTDRPGGEFEEGLPDPIHVLLQLGGHPSTAGAICAGTVAHRHYEQEFDYDGVQFSYTTTGGVLCSGTVLASEVPHRTIQLHGDCGTIDIDLVSQSLSVFDGKEPPDTEQQAGSLFGRVRDAIGNGLGTGDRTAGDDWATKRKRNPRYYQIEHDARAIESGDPLSIPVVEGSWTLKIIDAIRSATDGPADADQIRLGTDPL